MIVGFNLDLTPYSRERDYQIINLCQRLNVFVKLDYDYYLNSPNTILNGSGEPYQKFTPYYNAAKNHKVQLPSKKKHLNFKSKDVNIPNKISLEQAMTRFTKINPDILVHGGRTNALKQMRIASKNIKQDM